MPKTTLNESITSPSYRKVTTTFRGGTTVLETEYLLNSKSRTRNTVNTPGFRSKDHKVRRDDLPMNPFSYNETTVQFPYGLIDRKGPIYSERVDGHLFPGMGGVNFVRRGISSVDRTRIDNEALLASLHDLKGQRVNVGVTLVERKQTVGLILDSAKRLGNSYRALSRGDLLGAFKLLGDAKWADKQVGRLLKYQKGRPSLSRETLAVQLGWKPLIGDVYAYAEELAAKANDPIRVRVSSSRSHRWSGEIGPPDYWEGVNANRREFGIYTRKYVYIFSGSPGVLHTLASIGLTNPLSWAWELATLSFVVDWFVRVGDFIDALDATVGLQFEKGCKTTFEKSTVRYNARGSSADAGGSTFVLGTALHRYVDVRRETLTGFESFPPIVLGSGLSASRGVTAAALIRQYFKR